MQKDCIQQMFLICRWGKSLCDIAPTNNNQGRETEGSNVKHFKIKHAWITFVYES